MKGERKLHGTPDSRTMTPEMMQYNAKGRNGGRKTGDFQDALVLIYSHVAAGSIWQPFHLVLQL